MLNMTYGLMLVVLRRSAKCADPNNPSSSAEKSAKMMLRLLVFAVAKYLANSITAEVPEALSLAPLAIVSSPTFSAVPM